VHARDSDAETRRKEKLEMKRREKNIRAVRSSLKDKDRQMDEYKASTKAWERKAELKLRDADRTHKENLEA